MSDARKTYAWLTLNPVLKEWTSVWAGPGPDAGLVMSVEFDVEADGRIIADIPAVPGCTAFGASREEAGNAALKLAAQALVKRGMKSELDR